MVMILAVDICNLQVESVTSSHHDEGIVVWWEGIRSASTLGPIVAFLLCGAYYN